MQLEDADRAGRLSTLRASTLVHPNGDWPRAPRATAHPRHGSPALFMLDGNSVLEMRRAQRPEYSLVRWRSLRKSRRHHVWLQDRPGLIAVPFSKLAAMNLEVNLRRERGGEHYCRLSDDKVKQSAPSKVNAVLRVKWNDLDSGTQFTCFTGTKAQILTLLGEQRGGCKCAADLLPRPQEHRLQCHARKK